MDDRLIHITFLRHGRSLADDEGKFEGRYDSPLTDVGRAQAQARGSGWLRSGLLFDLAIASPLLRSQETARIVTQALQIPLELDPGWMEVDNGQLAGLTFAEGHQRFPTPAFRSPFDQIAASGETEYRLHCRAALALERVINRGPGRYLVVAHGGILNATLRIIAGAPVPVNYTGIWFHFSDTGYARFTYNPANHRWTMKEFSG